MREKWKIAALMLSLGLTASIGRAQDIAESAAMSANSSMAAGSIKAPSLSVPAELKAAAKAAPNSTVGTSTTGTSPNLVARTGPPPSETNRKALEAQAGTHPAKLLLRSAPGNAEVFVNDLTVGRTPLLLFVSPGTYKVSMRGDRQEWGDQTVGVVSDETQVVLIHLKPRYASSVTLSLR
jgi:PEGA domain